MPKPSSTGTVYGIKGMRPIPFLSLSSREDLFPDQEEVTKDPVYIHLQGKGVVGKTYGELGMLIAKAIGMNEYEVLARMDDFLARGILSLERRYGYLPRT